MPNAKPAVMIDATTQFNPLACAGAAPCAYTGAATSAITANIAAVDTRFLTSSSLERLP
jgi:hypothetical protein